MCIDDILDDKIYSRVDCYLMTSFEEVINDFLPHKIDLALYHLPPHCIQHHHLFQYTWELCQPIGLVYRREYFAVARIACILPYTCTWRLQPVYRPYCARCIEHHNLHEG